MPARNPLGAAALGRPAVAAALLALSLAEFAAGGETVIQNDSVVDFGNVAIQVGFVEDERAAAWLTATCSGNLVAVRVLWLSFLGGQPDVLGQAITISEPGAFPVPGTVLRELLGPVMEDGFFNEFPVIPGLPMTIGEQVVVDFQFLFDPNPLGPSVVTDVNGCQAGKNGIFAIPPSMWFNGCALGLSGDIAIRGVLDCELPLFTGDFETGDFSGWSSVVQ
jgi:hypothetical protein